MKKMMIFCFCLLAVAGWGQVVDSAGVVGAVDSLVKISRAFTAQGVFDKALEINSTAEKIVLEKLGRETASYGNVCFNHGRILFIKRDLPEAEKWYLEAKAIREKVLGKEHPDYAWSLNNLGNLYTDMRKYEKAEPLFLEGKAIREKVLGKEHPDYIGSVNSLAIMYFQMGNYEKAEPLYLEAKAIREKKPGKEDPAYAESLTALGGLYFQMGNYEKAEPILLEAKNIQEKVRGKEHPEYARCLYNLAYLYQVKGDYEQAEPLYLEAKSILGKKLGKEHPDYAESMNILGTLYFMMGNYEKAEPYFLEAKNIRENALSKTHSSYVQSLTNLGLLYVRMGNYEKSELTLLEAKGILEKTLGKERHEYINNQINLGVLYTEMGNYEKAEAIFVEVKDIEEKLFGKEHTNHARDLSNLANLYYNKGDYEKAESYYLEAKDIREKVLGKEHPGYANILCNLAILYAKLGNYEKAERYYLDAKSIREKVLGKEHPDYADILDNLALLYSRMDNYERAEPYYLEAKALREKVQGKEHPDYAKSLNNLGLLYWSMGHDDKAEPILEEISSKKRSQICKAVQHLSERELNDYLQLYAENQVQILSFAQLSTINKSRILQVCYDNSLFYKGFLLNTANQIKHLALSDSSASEKFNQLKSYDRRLATQYSKPIAERETAAIDALEDKANTLEKELARTVAGFGDALRQVSWQEVQAKLQPGEAAIEFVHYRYYSPNETDSTLYAALLLLPADALSETGPRMIYLCEQRPLDSLLRAPDPADAAARLYATRGIDPSNGKVPPVYDLIWGPLDSLLQGVKTVYYSPSGLLHKIAFNAIPTGKGKEVLSDRYRLFQVFSTRNLVIQPDSSADTRPHSAALFGGIQYDTQWTSDSTAEDSMIYTSLATRLIPEDRGLRGHNWGYLPGTRSEVEKVQQLLTRNHIPSTLRSDTTATEEYFKTLGTKSPSPDVLHVATHGFFFPEAAQKAGRDWGEAGSNFKLSDHPLLRSGLLLAGANKAWSEGHPFPGREDGILTAYELSQMNLSGTKLAVLSACETGLGDIQNNEGVFGLQRALKMAGVEKIIVSLWQVPDRETADFMQTFYGKWLGGLTVREAFYQTQGLMRRKYKEAFKWAGFVLVE